MTRAKKPAASSDPLPVIRPRHVILKVQPGMPGYRRGCKCPECLGANRERMRKWREDRKKALAPTPEPETVDAIDAAGEVQPIIIDKLPAGSVTTALERELPKIDGASLFQETVTALLRKSARLVDNADRINRLDLVNPMQLRIYNGIQLLERGAGGATPADAAAELLREFGDNGAQSK